MEGNALKLFAPTPQAGSLKLPDLSLALGFEHRLGLKGKNATADNERDLLLSGGEKAVPVQAYRCVSESATRSRHNNRIEEEILDFNKIMNLAKDGRVYFYSLDVGKARWFFDATYSMANRAEKFLARPIASASAICYNTRRFLPSRRGHRDAGKGLRVSGWIRIRHSLFLDDTQWV